MKEIRRDFTLAIDVPDEVELGDCTIEVLPEATYELYAGPSHYTVRVPEEYITIMAKEPYEEER